MTRPSVLTIYDICTAVLKTSPAGKASGRSRPVTDGRKPAPLRVYKEGLYELSPDQILSVRVERLGAEDAAVAGYQRPLQVAQARSIARALERGRNVAPPTLGLGPDGFLYATDGQHRLVAAIIAWRPLKVVVETLEERERVERFADQALAVRPSADVLILAKDDPIAAYMRAAIEAEQNGTTHPLAGFVGLLRADRKRLGAATVYDFLSSYALNVLGNTKNRLISDMSADQTRQRVPAGILDEAAILLRAFGPKTTAHPDTYAPATVRALRDLAVLAVRRSDDRATAIERWIKVMPRFRWAHVPVTATRYIDRRHLLVRHWNQRLPAEKKIPLS